MIKGYYNTKGIDTFTNPLLSDGVLIHAVNVDSFPNGAKRKRYGYTDYLNTPDAEQVNSLWSFYKNNGTQFWNYRASGSIVYYSQQGTGDWTVCGNGTISNGAHVGHASLNDVMIIGDGVGSTRHTTNGTAFTNTTGAPIAPFFEQYQGRIHAQGTASTNFYSSANDPTNWQTSGTSDSSSFQVPGAGRLLQGFKTADRLILPKSSGEMYSWDGYSIVDLTTKYGPSSPYAIGDTEGYKLFPNRFGLYGFGGQSPELLSNPVQRQFYNSSGSAAVNNNLDGAPASGWYYNYLLPVGQITDDFTKRTISNAIIKYDFQKNEFLNWSFIQNPTAINAALDVTGFEYLYFGDANGNTFIVDPLATSDAGNVITAEMVFFFTFGAPERDKIWKWWRGVSNPGCQARVQVACSDIFEYTRLKWQDLGDMKNGFIEYHFPAESRSKFLFVRVYEASKDPQFSFYGQSIQAEVIERK